MRYFQKLISSDDPDKKLDVDLDDFDDVEDKKDVDMEDAEELQEFDPTQVKLRRIDWLIDLKVNWLEGLKT